MRVRFTDDAASAEDGLPDHVYDRLWDAIDRIRSDPEAAPHTKWASHVSTQNLWGTHLSGTDWTFYWRIDGDVLFVAVIARE